MQQPRCDCESGFHVSNVMDVLNGEPGPKKEVCNPCSPSLGVPRNAAPTCRGCTTRPQREVGKAREGKRQAKCTLEQLINPCQPSSVCVLHTLSLLRIPLVPAHPHKTKTGGCRERTEQGWHPRVPMPALGHRGRSRVKVGDHFWL